MLRYKQFAAHFHVSYQAQELSVLENSLPHWGKILYNYWRIAQEELHSEAGLGKSQKFLWIILKSLKLPGLKHV